MDLSILENKDVKRIFRNAFKRLFDRCDGLLFNIYYEKKNSIPPLAACTLQFDGHHLLSLFNDADLNYEKSKNNDGVVDTKEIASLIANSYFFDEEASFHIAKKIYTFSFPEMVDICFTLMIESRLPEDVFEMIMQEVND